MNGKTCLKVQHASLVLSAWFEFRWFHLWQHLSSYVINYLLLVWSGCLAGNLQQGRQVPWTHGNPTSQAMDTAEFPVLGHPAAFTSHQICLWSGSQWVPPPYHWFYHLPYHRWVIFVIFIMTVNTYLSLSVYSWHKHVPICISSLRRNLCLYTFYAISPFCSCQSINIMLTVGSYINLATTMVPSSEHI